MVELQNSWYGCEESDFRWGDTIQKGTLSGGQGQEDKKQVEMKGAAIALENWEFG